MKVSAWRKSSRSGGSGAGGNCVEVGAWRTSSRSGSGGGQNCVEIGASTTGVAVRDTKHRVGPVLTADRPQWTNFVAAVKSGDFDL
ncbi:DUF397 domain-containing protein [Phytomonospora sp. NPDC050363]|uniref:DUF397 domain-containing protein n=1 Tax=Phytomonospora sp. NPDC050363 TaxID=3155642 RepID=UPI0034081506